MDKKTYICEKIKVNLNNKATKSFRFKIGSAISLIILIWLGGWLTNLGLNKIKEVKYLELLGPKPTIVVKSPEDNISVYSSSYPVEVKFKSHNGMWKAGVKINGEEITPESLISNSHNGFDWKENVTLKIGKNIFEFYYKDFDTGKYFVENSLIINRLEIVTEIDNVENFSPQLINNKDFFGVILDSRDVNLNYVLTAKTVDDDFKVFVYKIGEFNYENNQFPVYFIYTEIKDFRNGKLYYKLLRGFVRDRKFMAFHNDSNSVIQSYDTFFVKSVDSGVKLEDSFQSYDLIPIPETKDFYKVRVNSSCGFLLPEEKKTNGFNFGTARIVSETLVDKYGSCVELDYWGGYFESEVINKYSKFSYNTLNWSTDDGTSINKNYSYMWYFCGGNNGINYYPESSLKNLKKIGKTSTGLDVLVPNKDIPFIGNNLVNHPDNGYAITNEEWADFINRYGQDYPILVISDSYGNYRMYIEETFQFLPEC